MKKIVIAILWIAFCVGLTAWGQTNVITLESIPNDFSPIVTTNRLEGVQIGGPTMPKDGFINTGVIATTNAEYGPILGTTIAKDEFKNYDTVFTDLDVCRRICFEIKSDSKRCVDLKWLYLFMLAAGIKEEK
jgi:hypothetical protein